MEIKNTKWYAITSISAIIIGLIIVNWAMGEELDRNATSINNLKMLVSETDSQRLDAIASMAEAKRWAEASAMKVVELEKRLATKPYPPKPGPAPVTNPEMESTLVRFGLADGLMVLDTGKTQLAHQDSIKVYEWASQALRVAPLEDRLDAQGALVDGLKVQVGALQEGARVSDKALSVTTKQLILTQQEAAELAAAMNRTNKPTVLSMKEIVEWVRQAVQGRVYDTDNEIRKAMKEGGALWTEERFLIKGRLQHAALNEAAIKDLRRAGHELTNQCGLGRAHRQSNPSVQRVPVLRPKDAPQEQRGRQVLPPRPSSAPAVPPSPLHG